MSAGTWAAYKSAYQAVKPNFGAFMSALAAHFDATAEEDLFSNNYGFVADLAVNKCGYSASFRLIDAVACGAAKPGKRGNIMLTVCADAGRIITSWLPYNYTRKCWVPYANTAELIARCPEVDEAVGIAWAIREDSRTSAAPSGRRHPPFTRPR